VTIPRYCVNVKKKGGTESPAKLNIIFSIFGLLSEFPDYTIRCGGWSDEQFLFDEFEVTPADGDSLS
jgi:hypothetical protein